MSFEGGAATERRDYNAGNLIFVVAASLCRGVGEENGDRAPLLHKPFDLSFGQSISLLSIVGVFKSPDLPISGAVVMQCAWQH